MVSWRGLSDKAAKKEGCEARVPVSRIRNERVRSSQLRPRRRQRITAISQIETRPYPLSPIVQGSGERAAAVTAGMLAQITVKRAFRRLRPIRRSVGRLAGGIVSERRVSGANRAPWLLGWLAGWLAGLPSCWPKGEEPQEQLTQKWQGGRGK